MSEKVVLPKFDLPGDRTHPAVKVVWAMGAMLLLCVGIVGLGLWRQHSLQMAAEARQAAIVAARAAEANVKIEEAKARAVEATAKVALEQAKVAEAIAAKSRPAPVAAVAVADAGGGSSKHGHHHGGGSSAKAGSKPVAKAGPAAGDDKKSTKTGADKRDDAAIDKLLASFKK